MVILKKVKRLETKETWTVIGGNAFFVVQEKSSGSTLPRAQSFMERVRTNKYDKARFRIVAPRTKSAMVCAISDSKDEIMGDWLIIRDHTREWLRNPPDMMKLDWKSFAVGLAKEAAAQNALEKEGESEKMSDSDSDESTVTQVPTPANTMSRSVSFSQTKRRGGGGGAADDAGGMSSTPYRPHEAQFGRFFVAMYPLVSEVTSAIRWVDVYRTALYVYALLFFYLKFYSATILFLFIMHSTIYFYNKGRDLEVSADDSAKLYRSTMNHIGGALLQLGWIHPPSPDATVVPKICKHYSKSLWFVLVSVVGFIIAGGNVELMVWYSTGGAWVMLFLGGFVAKYAPEYAKYVDVVTRLTWTPTAAATTPSILISPTTSLDGGSSIRDDSSAPTSPSAQATDLPQNVAAALKLLRAKDWSVRDERNNIKFCEKTVPWCGKKAIYLHTTFPASFSGGVNFLYAPVGTPVEQVSTFKYDTLLQRLAVVKRMEDDKVGQTRILHTSYKSPVMGIGPRDMVTLTTDMFLTNPQAEAHGFPPGSQVFVQCSSNARDSIPDQSGFVRGSVHVHGLFLSHRKDSPNVDLDLVLSVDPCGWVPAKAVDAANVEQVKKVELIRKFISESKDSPLPVISSSTTSSTATSTTSSTTQPSPAAAPTSKVPAGIEKAVNVFLSADWNFVQEKTGIKFFDKSVPWCGKKACLFKGTMTCPMANAVDFLNEPHDKPEKERNNFKFDNILDGFRIVSIIDQDTLIIHTWYKTPIIGIAHRDTVTLSTDRLLSPDEAKSLGFKEPGVTVFVQASIDANDSIPLKKGYVRGVTHCYAIILVQHAGSPTLEVNIILSFDPCGWIPARAIDATNVEQIEKTKLLMALLQRHEVKKPMGGEAQQRQQNQTQTPNTNTTTTAGPTASPLSPTTSNSLIVPSLHEAVVASLQLFRSSGWTQNTEKNGVKFYDKPSPYCGKKACLFSASFPAKLKSAIAFLVEPHDRPDKERNVYKHDRILHKFTLVKEIDAHTIIAHTQYTSPIFGVTPRDMVSLTTECILSPAQAAEHGFGEHDEVFIQATIDRRDAVPAQSGYVRASVHVFGVIVIARAGSTHLDYHIVMSVDPCGWVPAKAVDMANAEQVEKLLLMQKHIIEIDKKKN